MTTNIATQVEQAAVQIRTALTRLGYCHELTDGTLWEVSFKSLEHVGDTYGLIEVDTQRIPRRVNIEQLTNGKTLHHLTAVVGHPVKRLNTTGLTYCVIFKSTPKVKLPRVVPFDLALRPNSLAVPIGFSRGGHLWVDLAEARHTLVAGSTRSGKSTWLNGLLASLLTDHTHEEIRLAIVDPKAVEFVNWARAPHLIAPIATDPDEAEKLLARVQGIINERQEAFTKQGVKSLTAYNARTAEKLPFVVVVVDEFTDLALLAGLKSPFYTDLIRLVSKGAAFGVFAILATQNPKAEVINTLIRANLTTRIAFRCAEADQSRTILGTAEAAQLPAIPGRALARLGEKLVEVQTYHLEEEAASVLARKLASRPASEPARPQISESDARLVRYALAELGGAFTIGKLAAAFDRTPAADGGTRITRWTIQKTGERLEECGLLTTPIEATAPRKVTPELTQLITSPAGKSTQRQTVRL